MKFYYTDVDIFSFEESSLRAYWWTDSVWVLCDPQTLYMYAVNTYSGYIEVGPIKATGTTPNLSQLVGTPFGFGGVRPSRPVGGLLTPVNELAVLAPYLTLMGLIGAAATVAAVKIRRRA